MTPEQRSLRARLAVQTMHAQGKTNTAPARAKSPQSLDYWAAKLDPDGLLSEAERGKRAEHARKAYMLKLALRSSQARSRRKQLRDPSSTRRRRAGAA